jgi:APA family basic amino acid/polyamine antiporter
LGAKFSNRMGFALSLIRRKPVALDRIPEHQRLRQTLTWVQLIPLGVGAIVGAGIYTLIGVGANLAGPAVILSFLVAGAVCACAALCYAEVAVMIPASGSAYTYSYSALGEIFAWVVGWSLILEYSLVVSAVAVGWSGYAVGFLDGLGVRLPAALAAGPYAGGMVNLPAVAIVGLVAAVLTLGVRESANVNAGLVAVKIVALIVFIAIAAPHFKAANLHPFMPYGFAAHAIGPTRYGVMAAAAIIFFAFYGFDAISTAAEETKRPERDIPIGVIGSMAACALIYVAVAAAALGAIPYAEFAHSADPLALILRRLGSSEMAVLVGAAAVVALPTVILAFLFGQSRIFFVMARDGLLPSALAKVHPRSAAPVRMTLATALVVGALAGLAPLSEIASLANAGTLTAFGAVAASLLVLRVRSPAAPRPFRAPLAWFVGPATILGCLYLFASLQAKTQVFFALWNALGLLGYAAWRLRRRGEAVSPAA